MGNNEVLLAEYFNSIQGEFPDVGTPYTFIRFKACNLHCPFCVKVEDDKNFVVYRPDENEWFLSNNLEEILVNQYPILAGKHQVAQLENVSRFTFDHYYVVQVKSLDGLRERKFLVSFDHLFATVPSEKYRCSQLRFEKDTALEPSVVSRYQWTPACMLDKEKQLIVGVNGLYEIVDVKLVDKSIELEGLATSTDTFVYGDVIHHNCDSAKVMTEGRVKLGLTDIVNLVKQTGSILITGGEPGLYLPKIKVILDRLIQAVKNQELEAIYALALETNGYKLNDSRKLYLTTASKLAEYQNFTPAVRIAWSPKMYDDESLNFSLQVLQSLDFKIHPGEVIFVKLVYDEQNLHRLEKFLDKLFEKFGHQVKWNVALMPEATTREQLLDKAYFQRLLNFASKYKVGISPRLHILYELS